MAALSRGSARWVVAVLAPLAVAPTLAFAARTQAVAPVLRAAVPQLKRTTRVPVLLPSVLPPSVSRRPALHVAVSARAGRWSVSLFRGRTCGANACTVGFLAGERRGRPAAFPPVHLAHGIRGYFKPTTCGGSCSPPQLQWVVDGDLYTIQLNLSTRQAAQERSALIKTANSAIQAGPR